MKQDVSAAPVTAVCRVAERQHMAPAAVKESRDVFDSAVHLKRTSSAPTEVLASSPAQPESPSRASGPERAPCPTPVGARRPTMTDARPVAEHVQKLMLLPPYPTAAAVARGVGMPAASLQVILRHVGSGLPRTMQSSAAERLLALEVGTVAPSPRVFRRPMLNATHAVEHIRKLQDRYELASVALIARAAGISPTTLRSLIGGFEANADRLVDANLARKIVAVVSLPPPAFPRLTNVTGTGILRRLQGLCALGWPLRGIEEVAGVPAKRLGDLLGTGAGSPSTNAAVLIAWERLSHVPGPSRIARKRAYKSGWAAPLAWDEMTIDLPEAEACGARTSDRGELWTAELLDSELEFLSSLGLTWAQSLERLGVGPRRALQLHTKRKPLGAPCPDGPLPSTPSNTTA